MGKVTGFLEYERLEEDYAPVEARLKHYKEFVLTLDAAQAKVQGARCMDCGTPFCNSGCPVNNIIPDFNDLVYRNDWQNAFAVLDSTNNFPEFTGRICPAPCEAACVLNVNDDAVGIKSLEHAIIESDSAGYSVTDKGSITGTYVNGKPVESQRLAKGDVIEVGDLRARRV